MANFPITQNSVNQAVGVANAAIARTAIKRGWIYRVVANTNCWLNTETPAAAGTGMYLPANEECYCIFGGSDSQGTNVEVNVIRNTADGWLSLTPIQRVPAI
jgi:hypothetical protein